jgi:hypothetical protein
MRFMRWDRGLVVVTYAFSFTDNPYILLAFLDTFCNAPRHVRGWDVTAERLSELEAVAVRRAATDAVAIFKRHISYVAAFEMPKRSNSPKSSLQRFRVQVPGREDAMTCIAPIMPAFHDSSLIGRGTRGWVVWVPERKTFAWYKRAWRVDGMYSKVKKTWVDTTMKTEGAIYDDLRHADVHHIPFILGHGDIGDSSTPDGRWHRTVTQLAIEKGWVPEEYKSSLRGHRHYELLMKEVGIKLTEFPSAHAATQAIRDALDGVHSSLS